ncbi:hypothetical protein Pla175_43640 [Pirellulimonas nuda]|uniref:Sulfatase n=1 Tax=Pirellulimonas nuda TaxID=2528009 RepID=A0A518DHJ5_9BACT|nr:DUF1501 domain-containing protein [Pirellulimonas nuda]QDU90950.1 hypothetical protein Pla175_43640 [Pirellulimonas nuda]
MPNLCNSGQSSFLSRRDMLRGAGMGLGALALADLMGGGASASTVANPARAKPTRTAPKAKSIIWLFQEGGPSAFDLFDPKPMLTRRAGQQLPGVDPFFGSPGPLMKSPYKFAQYGESGAWVSDVMPEITACVDDIAFIKSMHCESNSHAPAMYQMNTGYARPGFPSAGAWVTYGLGSENTDLPGFVVLPKQVGSKGGALNWGAGFLPSAFQGTTFRGGDQPILNLRRPADLSDAQQRAQLDLALRLNQQHLEAHPAERDLEARIASFELAYRMQFEAARAVDLSEETTATKQMYGMEEEPTRDYGQKLLLARRLVERGVRFVQAYPADHWDAHDNLKKNHDELARMTDKPVAALLKDLKQRGLLETTLVVWGGEFGRLPVSQKGVGRDHNPYGFLVWMAGGGVLGGTSVGETDDFGYHVAQHPVSVPDLHATVLHLMGIQHERLTYHHSGRNFRLTDVSGEVITPILA